MYSPSMHNWKDLVWYNPVQTELSCLDQDSPRITVALEQTGTTDIIFTAH